MPVELAAGQSLVCRKETFLCAEKSVSLDIFFQQRLGAGFFGRGLHPPESDRAGHGVPRPLGRGGRKTLAPGERLLVHAGHIGMQDTSVSVDIQMLRGFRNVLFGARAVPRNARGAGAGLAAVDADMNLAEEIGRYLPQNSGGGGGGRRLGWRGVAGAAIGGILGSMFGRQR